jgi:integrase/recombinase XerC
MSYNFVDTIIILKTFPFHNQRRTILNVNVFEDKIRNFLTFLEVEKNVSNNTLRAYEQDLLQIVNFWKHLSTKEKMLKKSPEKIMQRYTVSLFYKKISNTSLARKFSSLRSFIKYLKTEGISIKTSFKSPRIDRKIPTTLTVDEIFYLLDTIKNENLPTKFPYRDKAIFELVYATGARCSELISIKLDDINFDNRNIKIIGKGKKERLVLFGSKAQISIEKYLEEERPYMLKQKNCESLFINCRGTQLTQRSVQRIFEMFRKYLKIERELTPHKIRHSFATHLLNEGTNLRIIQELLGHKSLSSTEIYTHVSNKQLSKLCDEKHPCNDLDHLIFDDGSYKRS